MDFFSNCKTKEEAKATFKRLCKCFHPDKGGEEALMIELKRQFDAWEPAFQSHKFNFTINGDSGVYLNGVYEQKISELNGLVYHLRAELDALRVNNGFNNERLNDVVRTRVYFEEELRRNKSELIKQQLYCDKLNAQLEEKKQELIQEREKNKNRSLADKIKTVFGYD